MTTPFETKVDMLADLWLNFRGEEEFEDFIEYNDLGLPLSYMLMTEMVSYDGIDDNARKMIDETFSLLLAGFDIDEDTGFNSLEDLLEVDTTFDKARNPEDDEELEDEEFDPENGPEAEAAEEMSKHLGHAYQTGRADGIKEEQERIQAVCEQAVQVYLDAGKGQKAVFWREAANDLKPIDWDAIPEENLEDYGF